MGRKPAPQPLTLSDATATPEEGVGPGTRETIRQVHTPTTATSSPTSPLRSPRSPLYPFRLGSKRSPRERDRQDQQGTDNARKHRQLQKSSPGPSPVKSEAPARSSSPSHPQNPWQPHHLDRDGEATSPYLPLAAALHDTSLGSPSNPVAPGGSRMSREAAENPDMAAATLKYTGMGSPFFTTLNGLGRGSPYCDPCSLPHSVCVLRSGPPGWNVGPFPLPILAAPVTFASVQIGRIDHRTAALGFFALACVSLSRVAFRRVL